MARKMSDGEWRAFISTGVKTGKLGVVRPDGRPHVVPVWFVLGDDDVIRFQTGGSSAKIAAIRHEPRVSLCIDDEDPPFSFVIVEATARIDTTDTDLRWRIAHECGGRYMGADRAEEFARRNSVDGECTVELDIVRVIAEAGISA